MSAAAVAGGVAIFSPLSEWLFYSSRVSRPVAERQAARRTCHCV